jgi:hypothetical protein
MRLTSPVLGPQIRNRRVGHNINLMGLPCNPAVKNHLNKPLGVVQSQWNPNGSQDHLVA